MNLLWDTLAFAAKGAVVALVISFILLVLFGLARRGRRRVLGGALQVQPLNRRFEALADGLKGAVLGRSALKQVLKARKKAEPRAGQPNVFVLDFSGDLFASGVAGLREEVSALLSVATPSDEVVVRLESGGGAVPHYGLAAAQLARLKAKGLKLTVCIDRVAASGGYMMAAVADRIVAAPFAVIGSIGVVAQVPNVNRLLKRLDVDFEELTAGEFKRTVSLMGPITEKGRAKLQDQLEETHLLFKRFVKTQRPALAIDEVATGEYWLGERALELGLVDHLGTSDEYLLSKAADANLFRLEYRAERTLADRFGGLVSAALEKTVFAVLARVRSLELR